MGLVSKEVEITLHNQTIKYYEDLGYKIPRIPNKYKPSNYVVQRGTKILVKVCDLLPESRFLVDVECDCCGEMLHIAWANYLRYVKNDGKYYCRNCSMKLYGTINRVKSALKNTKSLYDWCIENLFLEALSRWNYDLNGCSPKDVCYSANQKYWFKCPLGIHPSELKSINSFTNNKLYGVLDCKACNSFAQWGIDNLGEDFLEKYWDWEKNDELEIDPWKIAKFANKKIWIKCQEKDYHESYYIGCNSFAFSGNRCSYCSHKNGKVHPLDSLGKLLEDENLLYLWSEKNKRSPYEYSPKSGQKVWWKCPNGIHKDYYRKISDSNSICNFRCPECEGSSNGEDRISKYLNNAEIYYIPQKTFNRLLGLGGRNLSYDFYLPQSNLLIEYQGEMHERYVKGIHKSIKDFEKQQEHDHRKSQYAKDHNINLLPIWYYDYDNVESILDDYLQQLNNPNPTPLTEAI